MKRSGAMTSTGLSGSSGSGGGVTDGDKGDIAVASSGAAWAVDASAITTTKMGGDVTTAGKSMLTAADATAQRTLLGTDTSSGTRNAHGIVETGGPTVLAMGAVSNGQFFKRSGSTCVGATVNALATATLTSPVTGALAFFDGADWITVTEAPDAGALLYWNGSKWVILKGDTPGVLTSDGAGTLSWVGI